MRYHITKNGLPAECHATVRACPLDGDHYDDKVEALQAAVHLALEPVIVQDQDVFDRITEAIRAKDTATIDRLRKDADYRVRQAIARNPDTDWVTISNMIASETNKEVLTALAEAHNLSGRDAADFFYSKEVEIRAAVAGRSDLSAVSKSAGFRDRSPKVRAAYARGRNADPLHLFILSNDESSDVRLAVARNLSTPGYILETLMSKDEKNNKIRMNARVTLHNQRREQSRNTPAS